MNQDIAIQVTLPDTLIDRIADKVFDRIKTYLQAQNRKEDNTIMDVKGVSEYLGVTESWVREQSRNGKIPCFKTGNTWKFHKSKIDKHYQSRPLPTPYIFQR